MRTVVTSALVDITLTRTTDLMTNPADEGACAKSVAGCSVLS